MLGKILTNGYRDSWCYDEKATNGLEIKLRETVEKESTLGDLALTPNPNPKRVYDKGMV